jgi:DNA-directed RNA polymerase subunit H (RpoH/RPB5)
MAKKEIDVSKHQLVPKHTKLSDEEKEQLFQRYNLSELNLPKVLKTDSAVKSLNVKPGDVIKIDRDSITAGKSSYYRVVV